MLGVFVPRVNLALIYAVEFKFLGSFFTHQQLAAQLIFDDFLVVVILGVVVLKQLVTQQVFSHFQCAQLRVFTVAKFKAPFFLTLLEQSIRQLLIFELPFSVQHLILVEFFTS
jgi:hypothetical protein